MYSGGLTLRRTPSSILKYVGFLFSFVGVIKLIHVLQYVPQDTAKLIELQGGAEKFLSRLDFVFDQVCKFVLTRLTV
jgi:hypothetical protein